MLLTRSLLAFTTLALPLVVSTYPHEFHEGRDLAGVYYGPDTDNTQFLPVSSAAIEPTIDPQAGYRIEHLGHGTYFVTDGSYQSMFLVSDKHGVILVDGPPTIGYNLRAAIKSVTPQPVTHFVYSHSHADHVGAASIFNDTVKYYIAHAETRAILRRIPAPGDPTRPIPNVVFEKTKTVHVGNQTLSLSHKGPNHEPGNIFIYAPAARALMVVDIVYPSWAPFSELAQSNDIPGWIAAHDEILAYPFKTYLGGHLNRYGTRADVLLQQQYVQDLFTNCRDTINGGFNVTEAIAPVASQKNAWATFKVYLKVATDVCTEKTNREWAGRGLAGLDVFGWENAYKMVESLRIDYGVLGPFAVQEPKN